MGYFVKKKSNMNSTLYSGLGTGLCGSITTFSTWNVIAMKHLISYPGTVIESDQSRFWIWLTVLVVGMTAPYGAFTFGRDLSDFSPVNSAVSKVNMNKMWDAFFVLCFIIGTAIVIAVNIVYDNYYIMFGLIFGAFGTSMRYVLSFLNKKYPSFPIGTFTANVCGSWLLGILTVITTIYSDPTHEKSL